MGSLGADINPDGMDIDERRASWVKRIQRLARWRVDIEALRRVQAARPHNAGIAGKVRRKARAIERLEAEIEWLESV